MFYFVTECHTKVRLSAIRILDVLCLSMHILQTCMTKYWYHFHLRHGLWPLHGFRLRSIVRSSPEFETCKTKAVLVFFNLIQSSWSGMISHCSITNPDFLPKSTSLPLILELGRKTSCRSELRKKCLLLKITKKSF